jgi:hypothetical protein
MHEQEVVENPKFNNHETNGEGCETFLLEKDFDTSTYVTHNFCMNYQYRAKALAHLSTYAFVRNFFKAKSIGYYKFLE